MFMTDIVHMLSNMVVYNIIQMHTVLVNIMICTSTILKVMFIASNDLLMP